MQSHSKRNCHSDLLAHPTHFHQKEVNTKSYNQYNLLDRIETMSEYFIDQFSICVPNKYTDDSELASSSQGKSRKLTITQSDIKLVPPFYPLDRTCKVIENISADELSEHLTKCIRIFNLAANWDVNNPTRLCCSTDNFLKFEINIWKHDDDTTSQNKSSEKEATVENKKGESNVILEIRRHDGDCVRFHRLRTALFNFLRNVDESNNYVEGLKEHNTTKNMSRVIKKSTIIPHLRPLALDNLMDVLNSVALSYELIFNGNTVDTLTGLKMLIFLSDATSIHRVYAAHVSDFILLGHDAFGNYVPAVRDVIYNYVVNQRNCIEHHYALQILANSFQNSSLKQDILTNTQPDTEMWNGVLPSLVLDIEDAEKSPHIAYNSIKCIKAWYNLAGEQADKSFNTQILSGLEKAISFGEEFYSSLVTESNELKTTDRKSVV